MTSVAPAGRDRDFVCVDLETTGGSPSRNRIIEIGVVEVDRDGTTREWSTLVNPGVRIPAQIEAFTGISNDMVVDAPAFADVRRELLERLAGRVFVAHNARFDYGFIRAELARLELSYTARVLCTVKLSRRLFPEQRRHNLDSVMERHGLSCSARHRALGDAQVLHELLRVFERAVGPVRLGEMIDLLLQETPLPAQLPAGLDDEMPELSGVYRFYGEEGALLYVGKSRNIRKRVLEHFAADHRSATEQRLAQQVRRVEWTETAGELGALLIEARAVKNERPLHNRRLRGAEASWTLRLAPRDGAPSLLEIVELDALDVVARAEVYGLYRDRRAAARAVEEIVRAHQLCARALGLERGTGADPEAGSCFAFQLKRCRGACLGQEPAVLHDTRVRLALASLRLKPWPYPGRILVAERDWRGQEDLHVLDSWRYLGTVHEPEEALRLDADAVPFDPDVYRILKKFLSAPDVARIVELKP
ncbi:MAG: exonuclease domain-containing protein [Proteobacteria bacterium]|nr:exonuclease domain-containing protein [Pseudomonadota bacterium]